MTKVAVVGTGYWGKNLVRVFYELGYLSAVVDVNYDAINTIKMRYREIKTYKVVDNLLEKEDIDAVVVAVPAVKHYEVAKKVLQAGKHVYVEKPLTLDIKEAQELIDLAEKKRKILMVGHLLLYHPVIREIKKIIDSGEIGELLYIYGTRVNLGKIRTDENALWSLMPHDISVALYLFKQKPKAVSATGAAYLQKEKGIHDVVFLNILFQEDKLANFHASWLDPHKVRTLTLVGTKKMIVFDDMSANEKLRIYDKGVDINTFSSLNYSNYLSLRVGDIHIPYIKLIEPLKLEAKAFIESVQSGILPLSDGRNGLEVLKILKAGKLSLANFGQPISLDKLM